MTVQDIIKSISVFYFLFFFFSFFFFIGKSNLLKRDYFKGKKPKEYKESKIMYIGIKTLFRLYLQEGSRKNNIYGVLKSHRKHHGHLFYLSETITEFCQQNFKYFSLCS